MKSANKINEHLKLLYRAFSGNLNLILFQRAQIQSRCCLLQIYILYTRTRAKCEVHKGTKQPRLHVIICSARKSLSSAWLHDLFIASHYFKSPASAHLHGAQNRGKNAIRISE